MLYCKYYFRYLPLNRILCHIDQILRHVYLDELKNKIKSRVVNLLIKQTMEKKPNALFKMFVVPHCVQKTSKKNATKKKVDINMDAGPSKIT
jgi:hypothetical protein